MFTGSRLHFSPRDEEQEDSDYFFFPPLDRIAQPALIPSPFFLKNDAAEEEEEEEAESDLRADRETVGRPSDIPS